MHDMLVFGRPFACTLYCRYDPLISSCFALFAARLLSQFKIIGVCAMPQGGGGHARLGMSVRRGDGV